MEENKQTETSKDTGNPWVLKSIGDSERHKKDLEERVAESLGTTKEQRTEHGMQLMKDFKKRLREEGRMIDGKMVKEY